MFSGDPAPFVMELPAYHLPTVGNLLRSMWERGWSFIKKAGTIILLSTILVWFTTYFGFVDGTFRMLGEDEIGNSILAAIGNGLAWIFAPLGWGNWQATVASITGLVAKENIVGTMGILYPGGWTEIGAAFTGLSGFFVPPLQPSLCSLLCRYGCYQERDEQHQVVLVRSWLSVCICLCNCIYGIPVRFNLCRRS